MPSLPTSSSWNLDPSTKYPTRDFIQLTSAHTSFGVTKTKTINSITKSLSDKREAVETWKYDSNSPLQNFEHLTYLI